MEEAVVWRFTDGRPGHDSQSLGLLRALAARRPIAEFSVDARERTRPVGWWLGGGYPPGLGLPVPDILLGAGRATHWHLLAARRCFGGRSVVLMKPGLPRAWFDLCIVPEHDDAGPADNQLLTRGVLNPMRPGGAHDSNVGLVALGGVSKHYHWNDDDILRQLELLLQERPKKTWWLTSSRRTPGSLVRRLKQLPGVRFIPGDQAADSWLAERMAEAGEVWVSEDSVSMIYEALGTGARVGLLGVRRAGMSRVARGVDRLVSESWVAAPGQTRLAEGPEQVLNEADRCAQWIDEQWLSVR